MYPYDDNIGPRTQVLEYRRVAVADDFFDIISSVHINDRGIHVGQKKTYRAVSQDIQPIIYSHALRHFTQ